ncbi:hypothetical protein ZYGNAAKF_CDS0116 [Enterococcus phage VRE9_2]
MVKKLRRSTFTRESQVQILYKSLTLFEKNLSKCYN